MTETSDKIPPVPDTIPVLRGDLSTQSPDKLVSHAWSRWFLAVRNKINVINASLVNLGTFGQSGGVGFLVSNSGSWLARTIVGTANRISVTNGTGVAGNPTIDLVNTGVTAAAYTKANITIGLDGRISVASDGTSDAFLLDRANHTGTQLASTISDFAEALDDRVAALLVAGTNITLTYNDVANTLTITATGGAGGGGYTVVAKSATYTEATTTGILIIECDATTASFTINLPTAVSNTAQFYIKKIDSTANTVTIDASGTQTIDGGLTAVLTRQYELIGLYSNNANWGIN